jgi:NADH dehydrogenase [ubiquinone] 1 alpha subcomplex assembly factor 7
LPIQQLICEDPFAGKDGWVERRVGLDDEERLCFVKIDVPAAAALTDDLPCGAADARKDDLLETCPARAQIVDSLVQRFADHPGRALFIDYGPAETEFGDTLQALKRHEKVGVFSDPGNTDLTARVDFAALSETANAAGLSTTAAVPQREFLSKLGLEMRAVALIRAKADAKPVIARQLHRLTDDAEMGELFKAICLSSDGLPTPLGLRE